MLGSMYSALDILSNKIETHPDCVVVFAGLVMLSGLFLILCNLIYMGFVHCWKACCEWIQGI